MRIRGNEFHMEMLTLRYLWDIQVENLGWSPMVKLGIGILMYEITDWKYRLGYVPWWFLQEECGAGKIEVLVKI